jgi:hypothetical protein
MQRTEYVRSLRLLAQTKPGAEAAVKLHVFGELLVEGQIAQRRRWINSADHRVPEALHLARTVVRGLPTEEADPTGKAARRFTFQTQRLYNADQLMRYIFAGAKDPHIWSSAKRWLLRATLRAGGMKCTVHPKARILRSRTLRSIHSMVFLSKFACSVTSLSGDNGISVTPQATSLSFAAVSNPPRCGTRLENPDPRRSSGSSRRSP